MNLPLPSDSQWHNLLSSELEKPYFKVLEQFLTTNITNKNIYPSKDKIFKAFELDYSDIKVCILGQDPYHNPNQANGLAFAVNDNIHPKPPSLMRIFKEIERDFNTTIDKTKSSLAGWEQQGVFLLNTILTVEENRPLSHAHIGWQCFTDHVISLLNQRQENIVFLLWGLAAISKRKLITNPMHFTLTASHPSPLARGFVGCSHFSETNRILTSIGKTPIDWSRVQL